MGYFNAQDGMSVQELAHRWAINGEKAYDNSMPIKMSIWDIWPYREYDWTKETARSGQGWPYKSPEGNAEREDKGYSLGPQKWDNLIQSMKQYGWSPQEPLMLNVGRDGKAMVGEGNHRLAVAMQLMRAGEADFSNIPVTVFFVNEIYSDSDRKPKQVVQVESFSFKKWFKS